MIKKTGNMSITYPDVILEVLSLLLKCLHRKAVSLFARSSFTLSATPPPPGPNSAPNDRSVDNSGRAKLTIKNSPTAETAAMLNIQC